MAGRESAAEPHVGVVVLSYNGREDTLSCLRSLGELRFGNLSVIVVDNGSSDGTTETVRTRHPDVEVIESEANLGFSGGNNLGLRRALELDVDYAFLLNNDTVVDPGLMGALVGEASRRPGAGALCPLVYYAEPSDVIWYAGARFDPRRGHNGKHTGYRERDVGQYHEVREVERASGAAMLVPRAVLEKVGLLDEELFLYMEDVEWSLRIRRAGYRIYVVPAGKVWHKVSAGSGAENSPTSSYYGARNTLEVCARHAPLRRPAALRRQAVTLLAHAAHARRGEHPGKNLRAVLEGWRDYRRGRLGPRSAELR